MWPACSLENFCCYLHLVVAVDITDLIKKRLSSTCESTETKLWRQGNKNAFYKHATQTKKGSTPFLFWKIQPELLQKLLHFALRSLQQFPPMRCHKSGIHTKPQPLFDRHFWRMVEVDGFYQVIQKWHRHQQHPGILPHGKETPNTCRVFFRLHKFLRKQKDYPSRPEVALPSICSSSYLQVDETHGVCWTEILLDVSLWTSPSDTARRCEFFALRPFLPHKTN